MSPFIAAFFVAFCQRLARRRSIITAFCQRFAQRGPIVAAFYCYLLCRFLLKSRAEGTNCCRLFRRLLPKIHAEGTNYCRLLPKYCNGGEIVECCRTLSWVALRLFALFPRSKIEFKKKPRVGNSTFSKISVF